MTLMLLFKAKNVCVEGVLEGLHKRSVNSEKLRACLQIRQNSPVSHVKGVVKEANNLAFAAMPHHI